MEQPKTVEKMNGDGHSTTYFIFPSEESFKPMEYTMTVKRIGKDLFQAEIPNYIEGEKYFVVDKGFSAVTRMASMLGNKIDKDIEDEK